MARTTAGVWPGLLVRAGHAMPSERIAQAGKSVTACQGGAEKTRMGAKKRHFSAIPS